MRSLLICFLLLWTTVSSASKDDCSPVDLTSKFGAIRNQGSSDHCYAFAAADLLGAEMGLKQPDKISALDLLSSYVSLSKEDANFLHKKIKYENVPIDNLGVHIIDLPATGRKVDQKGKPYTDITLAKALNDGKVCLENEIPSQSFKYTEIHDLDFLLDYRIDQLSNNLMIKKLNRDLQPKSKLSCTPLVKTSELMIEELAPSVNDWATAKLRESVKSMCKKPIRLKKMDVHVSMFFEKEDKETSTEKMNDLLNSGHPFILNYNTDLIETGKPPASRRTWFNHSSVVTGRRWNPKKSRCEIQIRESLGPTCSQKASDIDCENGKLWLPQDAVADSFHEVVYLTAPVGIF